MPKTMGSNVNSELYSPAPGVTIQKVTIKSIEDFSNYPLRKEPTKTIGENGFAPELCLKITDTNDKNHYLFGRFDYEVDKISGKRIRYRGWKRGGNAVWAFLYAMFGEFVINDDDSIPSNLLAKLVGKTFYKLRYCVGTDENGNLKYKDFNVKYVKADIEDAQQILFSAFLNDNYAHRMYDPKSYENYMLIKSQNSTKFNPDEFEDSREGAPFVNEDII